MCIKRFGVYHAKLSVVKTSVEISDIAALMIIHYIRHASPESEVFERKTKALRGALSER